MQTDENVTVDEVQGNGAVTEQGDTDNKIPSTNQKPKADTTDQTPQLSKEQIERIEKKAYGYAFGQVDQRLAELGFQKPDGVKTTDYLIDLLTNKKDEPSGTKQDAPKVDDSELGAKVKALQSALREKESELEQVKTSVQTQKRDLWIDSLVESTPVVTPDHLSEQEQARMITRTKGLIKSELLSNYNVKEVNGTFRFYNKDGSPILDGTIEMEPISPKELIQREFSEFIKAPQAQAPSAPKGTGTTKTDNNTTPTERVIPSSVKTANEFYTYLNTEKGYIYGSPEFKEALTKAKKERPSMFS